MKVMKKLVSILCALLVALSPVTALRAMNNASTTAPKQSAQYTLNDILSSIPEIQDPREELLNSDKDLKTELDRFRSYNFKKPGVAERKLQNALLKKAHTNTSQDYVAYVAKLDFLSYILMYQHTVMQSALNLFYLLTTHAIVRLTSAHHLSLDDLIVLSPEAQEEYQQHKEMFDPQDAADLTPQVAALCKKWLSSENPDIQLLAQIYCENKMRQIVEGTVSDFTPSLRSAATHRASVTEKIQEVERLFITQGKLSPADLIKLRQDPNNPFSCFYENKVRLMSINFTMRKYDADNLDNTYPLLIKDLEKEILIYSYTHTFNEKLYAVIQQEIERAIKTGTIPANRGKFSDSPLPKTLEPLHIDEDLLGLVDMHDLLDDVILANNLKEKICAAVGVDQSDTAHENIVAPAKTPSKSARKKANKRARKQQIEQQTQVVASASALVASQEQSPAQNTCNDNEQAQSAKNKKTKLEKIEEQLANLTVQQEQKETAPQKLSKAQRKKLNKERLLEQLANAQVNTTQATQPSETSSAPSAQQLIQQAQQVQLNPINAAPAIKKIVPVAADGSYVHEETPTSIVIAGPRGTTVTLQKKIVPGQGCAKKLGQYGQAVTVWQDNLNQVIKERYGREYNPYDEELRRAFEVHAFAKTVDDFIETHSSTCKTHTRSREERPDGETAISLPGKLRYANGVEEEGYFGYLVDEATGKCFHRMFERKDAVSALAKQLRHKKCFLGYEKLQ